jgi:hypothetical protein
MMINPSCLAPSKNSVCVQEAAREMGMGDVRNKASPKLMLVEAPNNPNHPNNSSNPSEGPLSSPSMSPSSNLEEKTDGATDGKTVTAVPAAAINGIYYVAPFRRELHPSMAMTAGQCVATACLIPGTIPHQLCDHAAIAWDPAPDALHDTQPRSDRSSGSSCLATDTTQSPTTQSPRASSSGSDCTGVPGTDRRLSERSERRDMKRVDTGVVRIAHRGGVVPITVVGQRIASPEGVYMFDDRDQQAPERDSELAALAGGASASSSRADGKESEHGAPDQLSCNLLKTGYSRSVRLLAEGWAFA